MLKLLSAGVPGFSSAETAKIQSDTYGKCARELKQQAEDAALKEGTALAMREATEAAEREAKHLWSLVLAAQEEVRMRAHGSSHVLELPCHESS
jgi:hypothetical protein